MEYAILWLMTMLVIALVGSLCMPQLEGMKNRNKRHHHHYHSSPFMVASTIPVGYGYHKQSNDPYTNNVNRAFITLRLIMLAIIVSVFIYYIYTFLRK